MNLNAADQPLCGISLPSGSVFHGGKVQVHVGFAPTSFLTSEQATMYAVEAWVLPIQDPDLADTLLDIWNLLVPKDTDVQTLDLDTASADVTPFFEPGEMDWSQLYQVGLRPERLYHRHKIVTINNTMGLRWPDESTPFNPKWQVGDAFEFQLGSFRVEQPSVVIVAASTPQLNDTSAAAPTALAEAEWLQVKFLEDTLLMALKDLTGLTEPGAESPWEEATDLIQKYLDPPVFEEDAGAWVNAAMDFFGEAHFGVSLTGQMAVSGISGNRGRLAPV